MSYTKQALSGFSWQSILKVLTAIITLGKISVLARLLTPDDFGLFSLTVITLGLSEAAAQTGINITILQSKKSTKYFVDTAWVIAIARGLIIALLMILMGFGLQSYFHQPELLPLVALTALVPIIKGFINPYIVSLMKEFKFFKDSLYRFSLSLVEGLAAVTFGFILKSVSAMILGLIAAAIFEVTISFLFFKIRPKFRYLKSRAEVIFNNAKWMSLASLLGYLNDNLDDFVIGKLVGTYQLGLYHNAYALSHKLNYDLARSVHHGTLPVYTKIKDDKKRLNKALLKTLSLSLGLFLLAGLPVFFFPETLVTLILGQQWLEVVPLLSWLVVAGIAHSIALLGYTLFLARSKFGVLNRHQSINLGLTIGLIIWWGSAEGLRGAAMGLAVGRLLALPVIFYGIYQQLKK